MTVPNLLISSDLVEYQARTLDMLFICNKISLNGMLIEFLRGNLRFFDSFVFSIVSTSLGVKIRISFSGICVLKRIHNFFPQS